MIDREALAKAMYDEHPYARVLNDDQKTWGQMLEEKWTLPAHYLRQVDAILTALDTAGYCIVPKEANLDMKEAATYVSVDRGDGGQTALNWEEAATVWQVMVAKAQEGGA